MVTYGSQWRLRATLALSIPVSREPGSLSHTSSLKRYGLAISWLLLEIRSGSTQSASRQLSIPRRICVPARSKDHQSRESHALTDGIDRPGQSPRSWIAAMGILSQDHTWMLYALHVMSCDLSPDIAYAFTNDTDYHVTLATGCISYSPATCTEKLEISSKPNNKLATYDIFPKLNSSDIL